MTFDIDDSTFEYSLCRQLLDEGAFRIMNTIRSTWVGWGSLCVAGGGAYYFAKKSINADRNARFEAERKKKAQLAQMESEHRRQEAVRLSTATPSESPSLKRANMARVQAAGENSASPSTEASHDPAATRHEPDTDAERELEKSKYETTQPFRPPKGNRLS